MIGGKIQRSEILCGGVTELVGPNEEVNTDDYGASVGVDLGRAYSGEITSFAFYASQTGIGAIWDSEGWLYVFSANPNIASGNIAISSREIWMTVLSKVRVESTDWAVDSNGGMAYISDVVIPFHELDTLYFAWFHTDAIDLNDAMRDNEHLDFNFWYR